MKRLKIKFWRATLKRRYLAYIDYQSSFSCGNTLAEHISPSLCSMKQFVNEAIKKLRELDPENAPNLLS
jgi:hypothetical protein